LFVTYVCEYLCNKVNIKRGELFIREFVITVIVTTELDCIMTFNCKNPHLIKVKEQGRGFKQPEEEGTIHGSILSFLQTKFVDNFDPLLVQLLPKGKYRVCHRFRLMKQDDYFQVSFEHF